MLKVETKNNKKFVAKHTKIFEISYKPILTYKYLNISDFHSLISSSKKLRICAPMKDHFMRNDYTPSVIYIPPQQVQHE